MTLVALALSGCGGGGGGDTSSSSITQPTPPPTPGATPNVQLSASPPGVAPGDSTTLNWSSTNADTCTASGVWSGGKALSGSENTGAINQDQTYQLTCTGSGSASAMAMTTVTVRTASLTWDAPTQNVDGSPLTDPAGYRVYWGNAPRTYGVPAAVSDPSVTSHVIALSPDVYYFAVTALDVDGNESAFSNEVSKAIF